MVLTIFYLFMWGLGAKRGFETGAQKALQDTGLAYAGDFLSYGVGPLSSTHLGWKLAASS